MGNHWWPISNTSRGDGNKVSNRNGDPLYIKSDFLKRLISPVIANDGVMISTMADPELRILEVYRASVSCTPSCMRVRIIRM